MYSSIYTSYIIYWLTIFTYLIFGICRPLQYVGRTRLSKAMYRAMLVFMDYGQGYGRFHGLCTGLWSFSWTMDRALATSWVRGRPPPPLNVPNAKRPFSSGTTTKIKEHVFFGEEGRLSVVATEVLSFNRLFMYNRSSSIV